MPKFIEPFRLTIPFKIITFYLLTFLSCVNLLNAQDTSNFYIHDDLNHKFTFSGSPNRVICLAPNLTEMVFLIGQGDKIVGNTNYGDYPEAAKSISKVGDLISLNYETIVKLTPDLIFMTVEGNNKQQYDKLLELGFKVFVSNPRNYMGIKKTLLDIAKIFNSQNSAFTKIKKWDKIIEKVRSSSEKLKSRTAMFLVSINPLMAAGPNTFVNQYLNYCGLQNIIGKSISSYPIINREEVINKDPDFIIIAKQDSSVIGEVLSVFPEWREITAIKENNIIVIDPDLYFRPGPRFVKGVQLLNLKIRNRLNFKN